ncbi:cobalamin B12-binding domain-containing protein [Streptomyces sp. NBC_01320]|uniref:cobalamin B12-binding domain-containing protein n=1 Tax=Streptomyces sp. NBC_01320 TaxID=2903824 RepID=UPI002E1443D1|nr:cobalamin B12-binding domain-containing protein [Streptomyces sp. NBC_01320]
MVIAKPGLDGHDRGAKVIARALRDAGYEVIYTGLHQTPEQIVSSVIAEDVSLLGMSILSGAHLTITRRVIDLLREQDAGSTFVLVGGIIPEADITALEALGVHAVFTPGADIGGIVRTVDRLLTTTDTALEPAC